MPSNNHSLRPESFERLREQLATAAALCSEHQLLELADGLHDAIRRRRQSTFREPSSWQFRPESRLSDSPGAMA